MYRDSVLCLSYVVGVDYYNPTPAPPLFLHLPHAAFVLLLFGAAFLTYSRVATDLYPPPHPHRASLPSSWYVPSL